ncbi:hypothetical protein [Aeromonas veronii]
MRKHSLSDHQLDDALMAGRFIAISHHRVANAHELLAKLYQQIR